MPEAVFMGIYSGIITSTFMEYWGRAWADFCAAHWLHVHSIKAIYNSAAIV